MSVYKLTQTAPFFTREQANCAFKLSRSVMKSEEEGQKDSHNIRFTIKSRQRSVP